jgi:hypothetical protein
MTRRASVQERRKSNLADPFTKTSKTACTATKFTNQARNWSFSTQSAHRHHS